MPANFPDLTRANTRRLSQLIAPLAFGREFDRMARALLGSPRASSAFPIPVRSALSAREYEEASAINAGSSAFGLRLTQQTFGLFSMLRED